jgi:pimeloyl-ACP methyl ester carboxylesterase
MISTIILHGALGSSVVMSPFSDYLFGKIYAWPIDLPGHGDNSTTAEFSISLFSDYLKEYLTENNLQGSRVFGYSMGGYVALHCAAKNPGLISEIVTLGTKFDWTPESAKKEILKLNPEIIEVKVPRFAFQLSVQHHPGDWKEVVRKTAKLIEGLGNGEALQSEDLLKVQIPVTIARGANDVMVSAEESKWAAQALPHGSYQELEGIGHLMEQTDYPTIAQHLLLQTA